MNIHDSEKLNALLGKRVRLTMYDGKIETGVLGRSEYSRRYKIDRQRKGPLHFYKTHVRKIEEVAL